MDVVMGIVGSILISLWAIGLLKDTSHILLDGRSNEEIVQEIHGLLESDAIIGSVIYMSGRLAKMQVQ